MTDSSPINKPDRSYVPWYRRCVPSWRTVAIVVALMLAAPFAIRWYRLSRMPDVPVPFDVEAFCEFPANEEDNAYFYFSKAANLLQAVQMPDDLWKRFQRDLTWSDLPEATQVSIRSQKTALNLYRKGAQCSVARLVHPQQYTITTDMSVPQSLRSLQRLSDLEFLHLMDEKSHHEAAELLHDTFRASRLLGSRGGILERLIGMAFHDCVLQDWRAWCRHSDVTADDIKAAIQRLREDWKLTPLMSDTLKMEYYSTVNDAKTSMHLQRYGFDQMVERLTTPRQELSSALAISKLDTHAPFWQDPFLWMMGEPEVTIRAAKLYLALELKYCDLPFSEQPAVLPDGFQLTDGKELTTGLSARVLNRRLNDSFLKYAVEINGKIREAIRREAGNQILLETELMLQMLIRRSRVGGRAEIEQSLPEFSWSTDACSAEQKPIQYRSGEEGLIIWSVGANGADDGGQNDLDENGTNDDLVVTIPWPTEQP